MIRGPSPRTVVSRDRAKNLMVRISWKADELLFRHQPQALGRQEERPKLWLRERRRRVTSCNAPRCNRKCKGTFTCTRYNNNILYYNINKHIIENFYLLNSLSITNLPFVAFTHTVYYRCTSSSVQDACYYHVSVHAQASNRSCCKELRLA